MEINGVVIKDPIDGYYSSINIWEAFRLDDNAPLVERSKRSFGLFLQMPSVTKYILTRDKGGDSLIGSIRKLSQGADLKIKKDVIFMFAAYIGPEALWSVIKAFGVVNDYIIRPVKRPSSNNSCQP